MRVLIGTPIHQVKDYCLEKWIKNLSQLTYPADILLVDNSPGTAYVAKVRRYLKKYGIKRHKLVHLELPLAQDRDERIARSREIIRHEVLSKGYDAWFSWESDQIIPPSALGELVKLASAGDFMMVNHNNWARRNPNQRNFDFGVALISRKALEKYSFILAFGTDPDMPDTWESSETWFKKRVLRGGDGFIEADGVIAPIHHITDGTT